MSKYILIFSKTIFKKLKKLEKQQDVKSLLSKMFNKIEELGPDAGKLLDPVLHLYEIKSKKPPIRLYFEVIFEGNKAEIIDFEMKKSQDNQNFVINRIKKFIGNNKKDKRN